MDNDGLFVKNMTNVLLTIKKYDSLLLGQIGWKYASIR
jgi:hypothetical protein